MRAVSVRRAAMALTLGAIAVLAPPSRAETPAQDAAPGALRGTVIIGPQLNAHKVRFSLYPDVSPAGRAPAYSPEEEIRNVVLYIEGPIAPPAAGADSIDRAGRDAPLRVEQRDESFVPHILAVTRGSRIEFTNDDPIYHNVFSLSKAASFDLGRYPRGASRSVRFDTPGIVRVFCHIHSDMSAVILVLDNPWFTVPRTDGTFEIPRIPPGTYTVTAWHERAHAVRHRVTIVPGRTSSLDFTVPLDDARH